MFIKVILALGVFYAAAMVVIYFAQASFIYAPHMPSRELLISPANAGLEFDEIFLETHDQQKLHGWFIPSNNATKTILFFHGNAGNISHRIETFKIFHELNFNFFIIDYRGFGKSTGKPSEQGTYIDAVTAWEFLRNEKNISNKDIIISGRSLGGGVAAELATRVDPSMLILESTFTSMPDAASIHYPFMPADLIVKHKYETLKKLKNVDCPIVIVHSVDDEVIPFSQAQTLFAYADSPKDFIELKGGHGAGFYISKKNYMKELIEAFDKFL